ncbi:MAG: methyltransferase domain-containing protein [Desulfobaccales bacterium]
MIKRLLKANKAWLQRLLAPMQRASIRSAAREQHLDRLSKRLAEIVPDLTSQYTTFSIDTDFLQAKVRTLHAFQIDLVIKAINYIPPKESLYLVDIGDSSGTHLLYLNAILKNEVRFASDNLKCLSVNLDPIAVEKISSRGIEARLCRAEDLYENYKIKADLILSFEMLEHLSDPISFLSILSEKSVSEYFVLTVPYLSQSRVGLHHIRHGQNRVVYPENTHIFELSPDDWKLIFQHAGWKVVEEAIYRQYPFWSLWVLMKPIWKKLDFEGFYGVILKRDRTWAELYQG